MAATTLPGILLTGIHSARPAANAVGTGTLYSCTTHALIYQSDGSTWSTWANVAGTGFANPMTTQDDVIVGGASGTPGRLAKGSDGQVLTVDPTTHHLVWATPSAGFSNPMTTKGDLIVGDTGGAAIRKAVGSDGQVLTADAASTGGTKWAAAAGGSSIIYPALKPGSLDATYGDDFTTAALNARWTTAHGATLGDCFGGSIDGSFVEIPYVGATGSWLLQAAPAGDFTISAGDIRMASINTNTTMYGIGILDSSGDGVSCIVYSDGNAYLINTIAYVYSATLSGSSTMTGGGYTSKYPQQVSGFWAKITKSGTGYTGAVSWSGKSWDFTSTGGSKTFTPAYIGIGWIFPNSSQQGRLQAEWFNKS